MKRIGLVVFPGFQILDMAAASVFEMANRSVPKAAYEIHAVSEGGGAVKSSMGVAVQTMVLDPNAYDTLIVAGPTELQPTSPKLLRLLARALEPTRRVASICTGAFILAEAGLLEGRRATTHWLFGDLLAQRHPGVSVDTGPVFIGSEGVWTSAGITASFDLLLAFVEEDLGADVARDVARILVVFLRRTGNQAQFSAQLQTQVADRRPLRELQQYISDHPDADLSLAALADRLHMSPRHLGRVFCQEVGMSPGRYVERIRLETARRRLEESDHSVEEVALAAGFGSTETMRRVFVSNLAVSPTDYRRRFGRSQREEPE
jgi:transcriptional regulator GlxA family with amidase domain